MCVSSRRLCVVYGRHCVGVDMYEASLASVLSAAPHGSGVVHSCAALREAAALERRRAGPNSSNRRRANRGAWAVAARRRRVWHSRTWNCILLCVDNVYIYPKKSQFACVTHMASNGDFGHLEGESGLCWGESPTNALHGCTHLHPLDPSTLPAAKKSCDFVIHLFPLLPSAESCCSCRPVWCPPC